jgi:NADP-dependent 3-hydroxy acid dehydrogenase YdfG
LINVSINGSSCEFLKAISPGLVESDMTHANDEIMSLMPALAPKDVSAAVVYAISVKEKVQVSIFIISADE